MICGGLAIAPTCEYLQLPLVDKHIHCDPSSNEEDVPTEINFDDQTIPKRQTNIDEHRAGHNLWRQFTLVTVCSANMRAKDQLSVILQQICTDTLTDESWLLLQ